MISVEKKKAIARRYQEEVWGKGNFALLDEQLAPEFVDHRLPVWGWTHVLLGPGELYKEPWTPSLRHSGR